MKDAKLLLDKWLTRDDYEALAVGTVTAYKACNDFFRSNVVTDNFLPGVELQSYFLNPFVQYSLFQLANEREGFRYEFKPNNAHNCWHLRLHKDGLSMTSHFLGRNNDRTMARSAKNRAVLLSKNYDLFESEPDKSIASEHLYCQLYHGGWLRPEQIVIAVPTSDQSMLTHITNLEIVEPDITKAEQIREEMTFRLLTGIEGSEQNAEEQAG